MADNKKNIMLINPTPVHALPLGIEDEFLDMIGYYPPLGLLYIGTVLKQKGYNVKVLDCEPMNIGMDKLAEEIKEFNPYLVGVSTFTTTMYDVLDVCGLVKKVSPSSITLIGGHHPNLYPDDSVKYENVDFILQGEGEENFPELLEALHNGLSYDELKKITGVGFYRDGKAYINRQKAYIENLDDLPIIDRDLLPSDVYSCIVGKNSRVATIMSSRGCPFKCTFCYTPFKSYRSRSTENIVKEVEMLVKKGFNEVFFFDDLFAFKADKVIDFANMLVERNIKVEWSFRARVHTISSELLNAVKRSGCHRIQFGLESGVDKTLKTIRKGITTDQIRKAIKLCKKHGVTTIGSFMIGLPGETKEDMLETLKFSRSISLDYAQYAILMPFPFTELYLDGLKRGIIKNDFWAEYVKDPLTKTKDFEPQYWLEHISKKDLFDLAKYAFKRFYFRPSVVVNRLFEIRSTQEIKNAVTGALSLFKL